MKTNQFLHYALSSQLNENSIVKTQTMGGKKQVLLGCLIIDEEDAHVFKQIALGKCGGKNSRWYCYSERCKAAQIYVYLTDKEL